MSQHEEIKLFETSLVRTFWEDEQEKWYFCINDVVGILTESADIPQYIKRLRSRDQELNSVWGTICTPHQFRSTDGKKHSANCTDVEGIFRIIQSIPSTGLTAKEYKHLKGLHQENLRDNMTNEELVRNMLVPRCYLFYLINIFKQKK